MDNTNVPSIASTLALENPGVGRFPGQEIGIDTVTSTLSFDPTDGVELRQFELDLLNVNNPFLPIGGTVFIESQVDQDKWIYGIIEAYDTTVDPTVLTVRQILTSVTVSETLEDWYITVIDGPPVAVPFYAISGLQVVKASTTTITVYPGTVRDYSGQVNLTLDTKITKDLTASFAAGTGNGSQVIVGLTGTISTAFFTVTGVGTDFITDIAKDNTGVAYLADVADQLTAFANNIVPFNNFRSIIRYTVAGPATVTNAVQNVTTDTAAATSTDLGVATNSAYSRGGWISSGLVLQYFYAVCLIRNDSDGTVDVCTTAFTGSGNPDLPSGWTLFRVIAILQCAGGGVNTIYQPLYGINAPGAVNTMIDTSGWNATGAMVVTGGVLQPVDDLANILLGVDVVTDIFKSLINGQQLDAGIYTPTTFAVANLAAAPTVVGSWNYQRIGSWVAVSGIVSLAPTAAAPTLTTWRFTLPIASNFTGTAQASGTATARTTTNVSESGVISSVTGTQRGEVNFGANGTAAHQMAVSLIYRIL